MCYVVSKVKNAEKRLPLTFYYALKTFTIHGWSGYRLVLHLPLSDLLFSPIRTCFALSLAHTSMKAITDVAISKPHVPLPFTLLLPYGRKILEYFFLVNNFSNAHFAHFMGQEHHIRSFRCYVLGKAFWINRVRNWCVWIGNYCSGSRSRSEMEKPFL